MSKSSRCAGWMGHDLGMNSRVHPKYKTKYRVSNWSDYDLVVCQKSAELKCQRLPLLSPVRSQYSSSLISLGFSALPSFSIRG